MYGEDDIAGEPLEQAILDHRLGAADALLGRLENKMYLTIEISRFGQIARGPQQHRRVTVVAAGMHGSIVCRAMPEVVQLVDRQGIHVGAQAYRAGAVADTQ